MLIITNNNLFINIIYLLFTLIVKYEIINPIVTPINDFKHANKSLSIFHTFIFRTFIINNSIKKPIINEIIIEIIILMINLFFVILLYLYNSILIINIVNNVGTKEHIPKYI